MRVRVGYKRSQRLSVIHKSFHPTPDHKTSVLDLLDYDLTNKTRPRILLFRILDSPYTDCTVHHLVALVLALSVFAKQFLLNSPQAQARYRSPQIIPFLPRSTLAQGSPSPQPYIISCSLPKQQHTTFFSISLNYIIPINPHSIITPEDSFTLLHFFNHDYKHGHRQHGQGRRSQE